MRRYYGYYVYSTGVVKNKYGKILSPCDNGKGYLVLGINMNGKRTTKALHRILAECFIPNPEGLSDVDHIDGDRRNNSLENLRWVTHGENIRHSYSLSKRSATDTNNANSKLTEQEVEDICVLLSKGYIAFQLRGMGYPQHTAQAIKDRRQWKHISKDYEW
jgi:hypothetical protein